MRKYHCLEQRITGKPVGTVQTCTGTFAAGIEMMNGSTPPLIRFNTATTIMCSRRHRYHLCLYIYSNAEAFLVNIGKMLGKFFFSKMTAVQPYMFRTGTFHLTIDCACYDIPW